MIFKSFNSYLLSIFARNKPFEANVNSLATHFHILSIFYLGFFLTLAIIIFETITGTFNQPSCSRYLCAITTIGFIISIICLKKGHRNAAGTVVLLYIHSANLTAGLLLNLPLGALVGSFSYLTYGYFLTKSTTTVGINSLVSIIEFFLYIRRLLQIFKVTLTDDQRSQLLGGLTAMVLVFLITSFLNSCQKHIEYKLWRLLNQNYKRSENLTKEIVQAMNAKETFVSSLSHEVRNVLNSLNGSVDFLLSVLKDSPHIEILKNAKMSGEILLNLVSNALDAAKIRADKLELSYNHANLEDVIKKAFVINSENLKSKNITAKALLDSRIPRNLLIDSGRLLQILMNLMSNALKFTPREGQIKINVLWCQEGQNSHLLDPLEDDALTQTHIPSRDSPTSIVLNQSNEDQDESLMEFTTEEEQTRHQNISMLTFDSYRRNSRRNQQTLFYRSENWEIRTTEPNPSLCLKSQSNQSEQSLNDAVGFLKIQVSDTGCGIAKENLQKLFEMYIQADRTVSSNYGGTGLGLWICKQLCHKMHGDIAVYSQLNVGTKFVFYIPIDNLRRSSERLCITKKVNALVVDDHIFFRDLHKLLLEREGVQVTLANNGLEAIEKYKEKGEGYFDFIFTDLNMPVMDGFAATREIRKWESENKRKKVMIYFVSGEYFNDDEVIEQLKSSGGFRDTADIKFLRKPVEVETVTQIVKDYKHGNV